MIAFFGWLWAWWCDPAEMMRQRRQLQHWKRQTKAQLALIREEERLRTFATTMYRTVNQDEWRLECTCGWKRVAYFVPKNASEVRKICDAHDAEH